MRVAVRVLHSCAFICDAFNLSAVDPHFLNVSEYQEFIEEMDAVVECPAFFGDPPGTMVWLHDDVLITGDRFIPEDGRLTILDISDGDEGVYRCALRRRLSIVDSRYINVTVRERDSSAPRIVEPLNPIKVLYVDSLDLHCLLEEPRDDVYYTWTVDTLSELSHLTNTTPSLHRDVGKFVGGRYTCRVENNYGYDEQIFFVRILGKDHEAFGYICYNLWCHHDYTPCSIYNNIIIIT